ncbi:hypothetical protein C3488_13295 [Streptomyces sp. Ru72]|nr:hypothetical protein C3488_13295 [Streptomyces sp. Ru72]
MPPYETLPRFTVDLQHLTPAQRRRFRRVVLDSFVPDLRTRRIRCGLREDHRGAALQDIRNALPPTPQARSAARQPSSGVSTVRGGLNVVSFGNTLGRRRQPRRLGTDDLASSQSRIPQ